MQTVTLSHAPKIGDVVHGHTVTEVRRAAVFGVLGPLPPAEIERLRRAFEVGAAKPVGFTFRPGYRFATISGVRS